MRPTHRTVKAGKPFAGVLHAQAGPLASLPDRKLKVVALLAEVPYQRASGRRPVLAFSIDVAD
jgi:hypothetical protein